MGLFSWLFGSPVEQESRQGDVTVKMGRSVNAEITGPGSGHIVAVGCECGKTLVATFHSPNAKTFSCPKCGCVYARSGKKASEGASDRRLLGDWKSSTGNHMEIRQDGTLLLDGEFYLCKTKDNRMTLTCKDNILHPTFRFVDDNNLITEINGQTNNWIRLVNEAAQTKRPEPELPQGYYPCPKCGFISIRDGLACPRCRFRQDSTLASTSEAAGSIPETVAGPLEAPTKTSADDELERVKRQLADQLTQGLRLAQAGLRHNPNLQGTAAVPEMLSGMKGMLDKLEGIADPELAAEARAEVEKTEALLSGLPQPAGGESARPGPHEFEASVFALSADGGKLLLAHGPCSTSISK